MPPLDRAARRRIARLEAKATRSPEDALAFIQEANLYHDASEPLNYEGGYIHLGCGGDAERPSVGHFGAGCYCHACGRTIAWEETRRKRVGE